MQKNVTPGRRKGCPNYPPDLNHQLVAASCEPRISISKLALENGINANLLFKMATTMARGEELLITFFREPPATSSVTVVHQLVEHVFSINAPITFSWISTEREKQIVLRANRLMRVRSVRLLRSMRWVNILPVRCLFFGTSRP